MTVANLLAMTLATLATVAWTHYAVEEQRSADTEQQIRHIIASKAIALTTSHAFALKGLVADNAFGDVRVLIANAVEGDTDVVYGLFIGANDQLWAYLSPSSPEPDQNTASTKHVLDTLGLTREALLSQPLAQRHMHVFGQQVLECRSSVLGGEDNQFLGTVVYGVSMRRTQTALAAARQRSRHALAQALAGVVAAGILIFIAGIIWMRRSAGKIAEPVAQLTEAADKIASGERGVRVRIASDDELEVLADAFNHMLEANEVAMRELEATTERALATDRLKGEFLANMSHEIRTPMNGVLGMVKLIQRMPLDSKLRRYVDTIAVSADALLTVINDILDFSKLEAGKYPIRQEGFDLRLAVQDVAELLATKAHDKGTQLVYRIEPGFPDAVIGDPDRFRQVLNNLVGNAVKFTDDGEVFVDVKVVCRRADAVVVQVSIHDTGVGIDSNDLPRLWDAFTQADGSAVRRHGGTGLGLAICKRLVTMMHGEISARSELGRGSTFTFTLELHTDSKANQRSASYPPLPGKRVLLVEPNHRWRQVIRERVLAWGMACDARECLPLPQDEVDDPTRFDAAIANGDTTAVPASELAAFRRRHPTLAGAPLILLTTQNDPAAPPHDEPVFELSKPLRFSELYSCLAGTFSHPPDPLRDCSRAGLITASNSSVLVVDDNDINRLVVVESLHQSGLTTEEADDGVRAVEKFRAGKYLCVLMDCQMPKMDGYDAARAIRDIETKERRPRTPIIALTAHAFAGERDRVLAAGMDDYLSKPFRFSALDRILRASVEGTPGAPPPAAVHDLSPGVARSKKLVQLFLDRVPSQLAELENAIRQASAEDVRTQAHTLKGSCLAISAARMAEAADRVRKFGASGDFVRSAAAMEELRARFSIVSELLQEELADMGGGPDAAATGG